MCANQHCPSNKTCYRFTAIPSSYQTYGIFEIKSKSGDKCSYYWNNEGERNRKDNEFNEED